jgi:hypothetical protein
MLQMVLDRLQKMRETLEDAMQDRGATGSATVTDGGREGVATTYRISTLTQERDAARAALRWALTGCEWALRLHTEYECGPDCQSSFEDDIARWRRALGESG